MANIYNIWFQLSVAISKVARDAITGCPNRAWQCEAGETKKYFETSRRIFIARFADRVKPVT